MRRVGERRHSLQLLSPMPTMMISYDDGGTTTEKEAAESAHHESKSRNLYTKDRHLATRRQKYACMFFHSACVIPKYVRQIGSVCKTQEAWKFSILAHITNLFLARITQHLLSFRGLVTGDETSKTIPVGLVPHPSFSSDPCWRRVRFIELAFGEHDRKSFGKLHGVVTQPH